MSGRWDPAKRQAWLNRTRAQRTQYSAQWRVTNLDKARLQSRESRRRFRALHPEEARARDRRYPAAQRLRQRRANEQAVSRLFAVLGAWCRFCGETDRVVLQVDHCIPVGRRHGGVASLWRRLRLGKESPHNLQVLCANCHARKTAIEARARRLPSEAKDRIKRVREEVAV
jgi:5-methylcytosine-specific restriction endonuclease McrA